MPRTRSHLSKHMKICKSFSIEICTGSTWKDPAAEELVAGRWKEGHICPARPLWHLCHAQAWPSHFRRCDLSLVSSLLLHIDDWWLRKSPHWYTRRPRQRQGRELSGLIKWEERDTEGKCCPSLLFPLCPCSVLTSPWRQALSKPVWRWDSLAVLLPDFSLPTKDLVLMESHKLAPGPRAWNLIHPRNNMSSKHTFGTILGTGLNSE